MSAHHEKNCESRSILGNVSDASFFSERGDVGRSVSETAENCRRKAAACWMAARRAREPKAKLQFEELAQAWLRLAERAEREPEWRVQFIGRKTHDAD
jgi:hypothetical protein